jgi:hypothetical protein
MLCGSYPDLTEMPPDGATGAVFRRGSACPFDDKAQDAEDRALRRMV